MHSSTVSTYSLKQYEKKMAVTQSDSVTCLFTYLEISKRQTVDLSSR
jgi:hypothetical protein